MSFRMRVCARSGIRSGIPSGTRSDTALGAHSFWLALVLLQGIACNLPELDLQVSEQSRAPGDVDPGDPGAQAFAVPIPIKGTDTTLDVACWNIEWFGHASLGPSDLLLQRRNVGSVIAGADMDLWGVEEIVSEEDFRTLVAGLDGYEGLLASDTMVVDGASYYAASEQKVGLIYKTSVASVQSARVILTRYNHEFAGRPPLEVKLRVRIDGVTADLVAIVMHAKAMSTEDAWLRRQRASAALKSYIDATYADQRVLVIGDFNDDIDTSITPGNPSSYENFVNDTSAYEFFTRPLSMAGIGSTVSFPDMIDHVLATNEMSAMYVAGTAEVFRVDAHIPDYGATTSDHFPVLARYHWNDRGRRRDDGSRARVIINEILANEPGRDTGHEHVELLNAGTTAVELGGWTLADGARIRHIFPGDTRLEPGRAIVVFAAPAAIPAGLDNAMSATTGDLGLGNGGDTVTLASSQGRVVDQVTYTSSLCGTDGVSMNRSPDGAATADFVLHSALSARTASPGKRTDGAPW